MHGWKMVMLLPVALLGLMIITRPRDPFLTPQLRHEMPSDSDAHDHQCVLHSDDRRACCALCLSTARHKGSYISQSFDQLLVCGTSIYKANHELQGAEIWLATDNALCRRSKN